MLGSIGTQTGVLGEAMQPVHQAGRAWVADVNARGGLAGHPVRLVMADDGGDPGKALALARRMVEQDHIVAFFADHTVITFQAIRPYVEERRVPVIGSCNCHPGTSQSPMAFTVGASAEPGVAWSQLLPLSAYSNKAHKASLLYCREAAGCAAIRDGLQKFAPQVAVEIVHETQVSFAQPDFTAEMVAARNAGADLLLPVTDPAGVIRMLRSAHRQGWYPEVTVPGHLHFESLLKYGGEDLEEVMVGAGMPHWDSPAMAGYKKALARYAPGALHAGVGEMVWGAGKLLEKIAQGFPPRPTKEDFLHGLHALNGETLGDIIPPLTFLEGKGHGDTNPCAVPLRVEHGRFVAKDGDNWICPPGWRPARR